MKVLMVSPVPTHPATSGNTARILALSTELQRQGHEVWFLHADFQPGDPEAMKRHWGERYIPHEWRRPWKKHRLSRCGLPVPDRWHGALVRRGWAYQGVDHHYDASLDEVARALHERQRFDAAIVEYVFFSRVLDVFPATVRKLIDTHDVYSDRHQLFRANGQSPEWFYTTRDEERKGLLRADCVIAIQEQERLFFEKLLAGRREVVTVGHFVNVNPLPPAEPANILFLGSGNTLNLRSIRGFLSRVWPMLRERVPAARLLVGGGVCEHLADQNGVTLLGVVKTPEAAYRQAGTVINPISFGTGLKIKSLEALALGRPLVTTSCGAEGLESGAGKAFITAEGDGAFAAALSGLCNHPEKAAALARAAADFARTYRAAQAENLGRALCGNAALAGGRA